MTISCVILHDILHYSTCYRHDTLALTRGPVVQGTGTKGLGKYHINIHFLKPSRLNPEPVLALRLGNSKRRADLLCVEEDMEEDDVNTRYMVQYVYRNEYTQYLPHKLAEFAANNFPDLIKVKKTGAQWSVDNLNRILAENFVPDPRGKHIHTFEVLEWESEMTEGVARARCSPFKPFRGENVQVNTTIVSCRVQNTSKY